MQQESKGNPNAKRSGSGRDKTTKNHEGLNQGASLYRGCSARSAEALGSACRDFNRFRRRFAFPFARKAKRNSDAERSSSGRERKGEKLQVLATDSLNTAGKILAAAHRGAMSFLDRRAMISTGYVKSSRSSSARKGGKTGVFERLLLSPWLQFWTPLAPVLDRSPQETSHPQRGTKKPSRLPSSCSILLVIDIPRHSCRTRTVVRNLNARSKTKRPSKTVRPSERQARKTLAKKRTLLRAAAVAFRRHGFAATGMRDIARAADLSPGNLYYYFESKHELLYFCQDHSLDRMLEIAELMLDAPAPAPERLRTVIMAHLECMLDELDGAAAHLEIDALPAPLRARIVKKRDRYEQALRTLLAQGIREGTFIACDPALVTRAILGALNWTARWYRPGGTESAQSVATGFQAYLLRGLLA